jgi:hypothetical protein
MGHFRVLSIKVIFSIGLVIIVPWLGLWLGVVNPLVGILVVLLWVSMFGSRGLLVELGLWSVTRILTKWIPMIVGTSGEGTFC